jgi:hypothetical protein
MMPARNAPELWAWWAAKQLRDTLNYSLRSASRARTVLKPFTYSLVCSGLCAPVAPDLPSLA